MRGMETETLDKLYLEIAQFTQAKSCKELRLEQQIREIAKAPSWEAQAALAEIALADIECREPEQFATDWLHSNEPMMGRDQPPTPCE